MKRSPMAASALILLIVSTVFMTACIIPFEFLKTYPWRMKAAPLMTRWAADVDPAHALPEYPRPQMVRENWLNLNGLWDFATVGYAPPFHYPYKILVPFPMESALSGMMSHSERVWYRRTFTVPPSWAGDNVILHFGAVDWQSEVFINGVSAGIHRGGYDPFEFDITTYLRSGGDNEIVVGVYDPTDMGYQPRGKQSLWPSGTFYTSVTGIWQNVWLVAVPKAHIDFFHIIPVFDEKRFLILPSFTQPSSGGVLTVTCTAEGKECG
ncbi:MAG: sugar-binding domain-containing protein, partial [Candidatus Sigynarchaeota archaeon]